MYFRNSALLLFILVFIGCKTEVKEENLVKQHIDEVREQFAPDKRTAMFQVEAYYDNGIYVLKGRTNRLDGLLQLRNALKENNIEFIDSIQTLPTSEVVGKNNAIVTISVANLRSGPKHSAELATQATLGTPVEVLMKDGDWYYIQTPDNYLAWVDSGGIALMDVTRYTKWKKADKIIYTRTYGHVYLGPDTTTRVSDVVAGSVLEVLKYADKFYIVRFPDGRQGYVPKEEAELFHEWRKNRTPNTDALVETSKALMGVPYLWGGTSTKGMDCSGFTKTVYFLNGMIIPRDASQQVHAGKLIDTAQDFENLEPGDLLFFGRKATDSISEKVVHVGMWLGNDEFIHASEMVRISSMDENAQNYDAFNKNRYLRAKRMLNVEDSLLIDLNESFIFNDLKL